MEPQVHYVLYIFGAQGAAWKSKLPRWKQPKLYASVRLGNIRKCAALTKPSPVWNSHLTFSSTDATSTFNIQVKHDSMWGSNPCVGYADIKLGELLKACESGRVHLELLPPCKKSSGVVVETILLELKAFGSGARPQAVQSTSSGTFDDTATLVHIDEDVRSISDYSSVSTVNSRCNTFVTAQTYEELNARFLQQQVYIQNVDPVGGPTCLKNTRVEIRRSIIDQLRAETGPNIVWLHGVSGSGKSTIAASIEDYFLDMSQIGAFLKFERAKSEPGSVVREIAYKLALFHSSIGSRLTEQVREEEDIASASISRQFEKLLLQPLRAAVASFPVWEPVVIVLDALDECGTPETRADLMRVLKDDFPKLPSIFRFLITSRPEPDITMALSSRTESVYGVELDLTSDACRRDILTYLDHEMREIFTKNPDGVVPEEWPWDANMALLGRASGGLFIWASVAVRFVSMSDNPFGKLKALVSDVRLIELVTLLADSGIFDDDM